MAWFFAVLVVLALGGVAVVAAGHGAPMAPEHPDRPDPLPPADREITAHDLRTIEFDTALRGYRADEVDALLARLASQFEAQEEYAVAPDASEGGPGVGEADGAPVER
ncbi:DivIVA domain-containing protein [Nocardioides sp. AE5]|uniref:DivIVA domain-containing protein n=1 Tax=Nocardioides sp. AE5 TaxID=2962573 RepID=UPI002882BAEA|nr:DivIVA domain-containing protein [Nocardioides sp. AE5]MDT0202116.1 DivIVA domain-containing protein [Nocardioides sp. AE5]